MGGRNNVNEDVSRRAEIEEFLNDLGVVRTYQTTMYIINHLNFPLCHQNNFD